MAKKTQRRTKRKTTRAHSSSGFVFPLPLATILLLAAALSLTYLWLNGRADVMGKRIQDLEQRLEDLQRRTVVERSKWADMTRLKSIQTELQRQGIHMNWPDESHRVRIYNRRPLSVGNPQYARADSGATVQHD